MKLVRNLVLALAPAALALATGQASAATLVGDTVQAGMEPSSLWSASPGSAVVADPGVEFGLLLLGDEYFRVDIGASSVTLTLRDQTSINMGAGEVLMLTGLDFSGPPAEIVGFELASTGSQIGFDETDVSSGSDWLTVRLSGSTWFSNDTATITLLTRPVAVPEPASLAMAGLGILGVACLAIRRKRMA